MNEATIRITRNLRAALAVAPPATWTAEDCTVVLDAVTEIVRRRKAAEASYANVVPIDGKRGSPARV